MRLRRRNRIIGRKVEIIGGMPFMHFRSRYGKVIGKDEYNDNYLLILLDLPAIWKIEAGKMQDSEKIYVRKDNLKFL